MSENLPKFFYKAEMLTNITNPMEDIVSIKKIFCFGQTNDSTYILTKLEKERMENLFRY